MNPSPAPVRFQRAEAFSRAAASAIRPRKRPIAALAVAFAVLLTVTACSGGAGSDDAGNVSSNVRTLVDEETSTPTPTIEVTVEKVEVTEPIAYTSSTIDDAGMDVGTTRVATIGVNGVKTTVFDVTYEDGVEVSRTAVEERVSTAPVNEVVAVGSKQPVVVPPAPAPAGNCDPNYSGACVPIASDVDCAGGSGNGPAYVQGPVRIVGSDIYDLDRDGDGIACD